MDGYAERPQYPTGTPCYSNWEIRCHSENSVTGGTGWVSGGSPLLMASTSGEQLLAEEHEQPFGIDTTPCQEASVRRM